MKFDDKVANSPGVMKVATISLAVAIKVAASSSRYSAVQILNARNYMVNRGYKPSVPMIAAEIGGCAAAANIGLGGMVKIICDDLDNFGYNGTLLQCVRVLIKKYKGE